MDPRIITKSDFSIVRLLEQFKNNHLQISLSQFEDFIEQLNKDHTICVIDEDNKIISCGTIIIEKKLIHHLGLVAHIEDVITDTDYRGKGLAKKIIQYLIDYSQQRGCYKVILNCSEQNCPFYKKLGFRENEKQMALYL